jgi:hypothetical protein
VHGPLLLVPLGGNRVAMGQELPALHDLAAMVAIDLVARSDGGSDGDEEACMGEEICMGAARADYDALVEATAREALASDPAAVVVLHTVGGSKTGLRLPSPELSEKLRAEFGERVVSVLDACQMRHNPVGGCTSENPVRPIARKRLYAFVCTHVRLRLYS